MEAKKSLKGSYGEHLNNAPEIEKVDGIFPIVRCVECSFVYSQRLLEKKYYDIIYDKVLKPENDREYVHSFEYLKAMTGIYHSLLFSLNEASFKDKTVKIFDFGAGWGQFLEVAKNPRSKLFGFETSEVRENYMRDHGINVLENVEDIRNSSPFDVIFCNQVIEHVPDPIEILTLLSSILSDHGVAWVAAPFYREDVLNKHIDQYNSFNESSKWDEYPFTLNPFEHLNYFSPDTFRKSLKSAGLYIYMVHNYMDINSTPIIYPHEEVEVTEAIVKTTIEYRTECYEIRNNSTYK